MLVIPAPGRLRQEHCHEFKAILSKLERSCPRKQQQQISKEDPCKGLGTWQEPSVAQNCCTLGNMKDLETGLIQPMTEPRLEPTSELFTLSSACLGASPSLILATPPGQRKRVEPVPSCSSPCERHRPAWPRLRRTWRLSGQPGPRQRSSAGTWERSWKLCVGS